MKRTIMTILAAGALLLMGASVASATYFYDAGGEKYHVVNYKATGLDCAEDVSSDIWTDATECRSPNH